MCSTPSIWRSKCKPRKPWPTLLHDVAEDTDCTLEDLAKMGYPQPVLVALALMSHDSGTPYLTYVARLKHNPFARTVKLADLRHNSDLSRLDRVDAKALERVEKYKKTMALLLEE